MSDDQLKPTKTLASETAHAEEPDPHDPEAADEARAAVEETVPVVELAEPTTGWQRWLPLALAAALPILFFLLLPPLTKSGLWDPFELNVADLGRRLALNLFGAPLSLEGADNSMPHLNDLGRPELPFESIALGFRVFGLHEWAGRLPLALWGIAGVLATYAFVSRLIDKRAGLFSAAALTTTPLFFVQARTMLGDVVSMSALAMAFGGLAVAAFDRDDKGPTSIAKRAPWVALGIVGLLAGYESRGGLLGVAVPALSVALAYGVVTLSSSEEQRDGIGDVVAGASAVVGGVALVFVLRAFAQDRVVDLNPWLGAMVKTQSKYPTFDYYVGHIAHSCAPWSAFVPFALGRLFIAPVGRTGHLARRESAARVAIVVGASVAFVAHGWLAARVDLIPFVGPALLAAACGIAIRDFDRGAHPSIALGVGTMFLLACMHHDFHELPEKAYQAFGVVQSTFPEGFKDKALVLWTLALIGFAGLFLVTWVERTSAREPFHPALYLKILYALRDAWDGLLALAFFALVAGFSLGALAIWIGVKWHMSWLPNLSLMVRDGLLNAWWVAAFVPLGGIFAILFACDVILWAFRRPTTFSIASLTRGFEPFEALYAQVRGEGLSKGPGGKESEDATGERLIAVLVILPLMVLAIPAAAMAVLVHGGTKPVFAALMAVPSSVVFFLVLGLLGDLLAGRRAWFLPVVGVLSGVVLCVAYYPALANQLSPKEVFESYQKVHKGGEPLALFGVGGKTAAYYAGGQPTQLHDPNGAYQWLTSASSDNEGRRYLATKTDELAKLNMLFRQSSQPRENLPVLDARSQILLVASKLETGEKNENPLGKMVLSSEPKPQHKLDVNMEDKLQVLGFDVTDEAGHWVNVVVPGTAYRMRTYYRVLAPVTTEWEAFIHIDGYHRRHNGDHKPMEGKYPFSLWLPGDLLVDDYEFKLEPNFSPGNYTVYFGLFVGDTRLKVKSGPSDGDNRINGGPLRVQ
ncbi:MAG TPA: glycosyltransferase family 39 protein [Polyangiaceae bacterium]|jgi:4-amino-4-deoxy-L-arabinose transferase-like glycosyltransferase